MKKNRRKRSPCLRKTAEKLLKREPESMQSPSSVDIQKLIHELNVHQIELEMQNEELRQAQEEVAESRNRYSDLYDFAPVGYLTLNKTGLIAEVNLTGADMLGVERRYLINNRFSGFIDSDYQDAFYLHRKKAFETGNKQSCQLRLVRKDGAKFYVQMKSIAVKDDKGDFTQLRSIITDISQLIQTEKMLLHSEKLAAIGRLSASIAHEMGNPIFAIRNVLSALSQKRALNKTDKQLVGLTLEECNRLLKLLGDLRDFNRPAAGVIGPTNIHNIIDQMLSLYSKRFKERKIKIKKHYVSDLPEIQAIEDQIRQVVLNLLINAEEAIPVNGGTIKISTENKKDEVVIRLEDSGKGVKPEIKSRIFEPFFSTKQSVLGTGMGLSVSYGIIKNHGGKIEVESDPTQGGSTFIVTLPVNGKK